MVAAPIALDIDPVTASQIIGILFFIGSLLITYFLARLIFENHLQAILALVFTGTNFTFSAYATGGLETSMQSMLLVCSVFLTLLIINDSRWRFGPLVVLSFIFSAALLTRLDFVIPMIVLWGFILLEMARQISSIPRRILTVIYLALPTLIIMGIWFAFRQSYYGEILPDTYYAKTSMFSLLIVREGLLYIDEFLTSYILIPFVILGVVFIGRIWDRRDLRLILIIIILWCLYIIRVGGGFMEFRFMAPVIPLIFIMIVYLVAQLSSRKIRYVFISLVFIGSLHHALTFRLAQGIESVKGLNSHLVDKRDNWIGIGRLFGKLFSGSEEPVLIATTAAGAIPYYSELPTVDMHGMNDRWIAKNGVIIGIRPGHQRVAPLKYLVERRDNIVIGHPVVRPISVTPCYSLENLDLFKIYDADSGLLAETAKVIDIPIDGEYKVSVLYLCPNEYVDKVIEDLDLKTYEIIRGS